MQCKFYEKMNHLHNHNADSGGKTTFVKSSPDQYNNVGLRKRSLTFYRPYRNNVCL